jgi:hypothetical protein
MAMLYTRSPIRLPFRQTLISDELNKRHAVERYILCTSLNRAVVNRYIVAFAIIDPQAATEFQVLRRLFNQTGSKIRNTEKRIFRILMFLLNVVSAVNKFE